jgi:hypothetical protein
MPPVLGADAVAITLMKHVYDHFQSTVHRLSGEAEELEKHRLDHRRNVANALSEVTNKLVAITVDHFGILRSLVHLATSLVGSVGDAKYSRPLLELLVATLGANKSISKSMSNQEAWTLASVSRVCIINEGFPLSRCMLKTWIRYQ